MVWIGWYIVSDVTVLSNSPEIGIFEIVLR